VTNTFVLPSWPGTYLAGARANRWAWHRKHVTTVTSVYTRTRSVVNKVHPFQNRLHMQENARLCQLSM